MIFTNNIPLNHSDRQKQTGLDLPLLSVIIPVYNVAAYLPKCLSFLEKQSHPDELEFIVIDDGSTDGSAGILDAAAQRDGRYRVFHQENQGVSMARNAGLSHVRGKYIAWVDPDDWIASDWYEKQRPYLLDGVDMVYFDMVIVYNGKQREFHWSDMTRPMLREELFHGMTTGRIASHLWSKTIKSSFWAKNDVIFGPKISYCEDYSVLHHVVIDVHRIIYLHDCLYYYLQRDGSIVNDSEQVLDNVWASIGYARERVKFFKAHGIKESDSGILFLEMEYLRLCVINDAVNNSEIGKRAQKMRSHLQRYGYKLLFSCDYPFEVKIKTIILCLHLEKVWFMFFHKLYEKLKQLVNK